jgi:hypothetical protein
MLSNNISFFSIVRQLFALLFGLWVLLSTRILPFASLPRPEFPSPLMNSPNLCSSILPSASEQEGISRDQRIFSASVAFVFLMKMYAPSDLSRHRGVALVWRKEKSLGCLLAAESVWHRLSNTMFGLCRFLKHADPAMSGNRFGTHSAESYIGLIRRPCHQYDDMKRLQHVAARAEQTHRAIPNWEFR